MKSLKNLVWKMVRPLRQRSRDVYGDGTCVVYVYVCVRVCVRACVCCAHQESRSFFQSPPRAVYLRMAQCFVEAMNKGGMPSIRPSWSAVVTVACKSASVLLADQIMLICFMLNHSSTTLKNATRSLMSTVRDSLRSAAIQRTWTSLQRLRKSCVSLLLVVALLHSDINRSVKQASTRCHQRILEPVAER